MPSNKIIIGGTYWISDISWNGLAGKLSVDLIDNADSLVPIRTLKFHSVCKLIADYEENPSNSLWGYF